MSSVEKLKQVKNAGICGVDIYVPKLCVSQSELEKFDNVSSGKYTIGLGQQRMGFCCDREDIYSIALTVVNRLLTKYKIDHKAIGRLVCATETILDHSKSIKSYLMQLFDDSGNHDIEGVDMLHACYSGSAALFDSIAWAANDNWDGRYALVVAVDIAEYAKGAARPTGGAAAAAILIGRNAPITLGNVRSSFMTHAYDFYKPDLGSPYPIVDGPLSNQCFISAIDQCYDLFTQKYNKKNNREFRAAMVDYWLFHSPYNKLVQKSFGRIIYNDFVRNSDDSNVYSQSATATIEKFATIQPSDIKQSQSRACISAFTKFSANDYKLKVAPGAQLAQQIGNAYTASIIVGFASLLASIEPKSILGKSVGIFSYGSGLCSSMYTLQISDDKEMLDQLQTIHSNLNRSIESTSQRIVLTPKQFTKTLEKREALHKLPRDEAYIPTDNIDYVWSDAYCLVKMDNKKRRTYVLQSEIVSNPQLYIPEVTATAEEEKEKETLISSEQSSDKKPNSNAEKKADDTHATMAIVAFLSGSVASLGGYALFSRYFSSQ